MEYQLLDQLLEGDVITHKHQVPGRESKLGMQVITYFISVAGGGNAPQGKSSFGMTSS